MSGLVDANILADLRKGERGNPGVRAWDSAAAAEDLSTSVLVLGEIRRGVESLRGRDPSAALAVEQWLARIVDGFAERVLPVDAEVADRWGRLTVPNPIPAIDGLLAATALAHDLALVTRNARDVEATGARRAQPDRTGKRCGRVVAPRRPGLPYTRPADRSGGSSSVGRAAAFQVSLSRALCSELGDPRTDGLIRAESRSRAHSAITGRQRITDSHRDRGDWTSEEPWRPPSVVAVTPLVDAHRVRPPPVAVRTARAGPCAVGAGHPMRHATEGRAAMAASVIAG